ncbi:CirA Outer membrane receptor proteins, mostly Fe transport [Caulobacteraceae bacterium]
MNTIAKHRKAALIALLGSSAIVALPMTARAQSDSPAVSVGEVIVTARKREERLQDVPMSISAIGGEALEDAGYTELNDLSRLTSNVFFEAADRSKPLIFIRGIGTRGYDAGSDPSVGVFVDGVYLGRFGALDLDLMDVERVEVLKGPQGTLYGRNTIGGAISVVTKDPSATLTGKVSGEVGASETSGDNLFGLTASVSGPISQDGAYGSLSVSRRTRDGYQPVTGTDVRGGSEDSWAIRGKTLFELGDDAKLRLSGDYARSDGPPLVLVPNTLGGAATVPGALAPGYVAQAEPSAPYHPSSDVNDQGIVKKTYGVSAQLDWARGELDFTSITAARGMALDERDDLDGTVLPFQVYRAEEDSDQFSQEFRVAHEADAFNWVFGLYYARENVTRTEFIDFGPASLLSFLVAPAPLGWGFGFDLESTSMAAFGQVQWQMTDALSLSLGARYSKDKKDVVFDTTTTVPGFIVSPYTEAVDRTWNSFDPSIALNYKVSDDVMVYASWATGYKSGAFQFIAIDALSANQVANPEDVESIEIGLKSTLFNDRLRFNVAMFNMDYKDLQQLRLVPIGGGVTRIVITNAASSTIQGLEVDAKWVASENWSFDLNYGYLDATFDNYVFNATFDFSGNQMPRSPKTTFSIAANYTRPTAWGRFDARLGYAWRDEIFFEADNNVIDPDSSEGALGLVDMSAGITGDRWAVSLWGRNLSDERYRRQVLNSTGNSQREIWAEPRTVGLRLTYSFGE